MANLYLIRDICESRNMTIRDLAMRVRRNESSLQSAMRRGSTNSATIELIAKELGVSPAVFFDGYSPDGKRDELLKEISHLKDLLREKERTIAILMADRGIK